MEQLVLTETMDSCRSSSFFTRLPSLREPATRARRREFSAAETSLVRCSWLAILLQSRWTPSKRSSDSRSSLSARCARNCRCKTSISRTRALTRLLWLFHADFLAFSCPTASLWSSIGDAWSSASISISKASSLGIPHQICPWRDLRATSCARDRRAGLPGVSLQQPDTRGS